MKKKLIILIIIIGVVISILKLLYVADNAWRDYVRDNYHFHVQGIIVDADNIDFVNGNPGRDYSYPTLAGKKNGNEVIAYNYDNGRCDIVYSDGDNYSYAFNVDIGNLSVSELGILTGEEKMSRFQYYTKLIRLTRIELKTSDITSSAEKEVNISFKRLCHFSIISCVLISYLCLRKKISALEIVLMIGIISYYTITILLNRFYILIL